MSASRPAQEAKEIELKLVFDPENASAIFAHPAIAGATDTLKRRELVSIYYDTDTDVLQENGVFLRVRTGGDGYVQTIKTARSVGEFLERDEWECGLKILAPNLDAAAGTALAPLLNEDVRAALRPRFETRFQRDAYTITSAGSEIELAVDQGKITVGDKASPVCELELELKSGDRRVLFSLAKTLVEGLPLTLGIKTKAERGFELLADKDHGVEKASRIDIAPDETCAEAFRTIARNCLRQILANLPAVRERRPEALHQMRVGLRRLRAANTLFADVIAGEQQQSINAALRWIGGEFGPARDLDVLIADVLKPQRNSCPNDPELNAILKDVTARRAAAYERAIKATGSDRFRLALIDLGAFIETGDWTGVDNSLADEPVAVYAQEKLSRLRRAIKKKGQDLRALSAPERHRLRIRAKRLRYATEFFATTFGGAKVDKRRRKSLVALQKLQDALGVLNDIATRRVLFGGNGNGAEKLQFRMPGTDPAEEKKWLRQAKRAFARFAEVKAFWKS